MAAGLGFKTFAVGEVLSAANVNGYLMQGVLVFANATARDAAITSPQEGQFAFTKDNDSLWYYSGSAWVSSGATGDIEGVTAGVGISGGGTSGTVTVTNSMATAIDAKGDLIGGTGADTFARLAVGANGTVLTADSVETTGLKWATPSSGALVKIAGASFSSQAAVEVQSVFTSTYDVYLVTLLVHSSTNTGTLRLQYMENTTAATASAYVGAGYAYTRANALQSFGVVNAASHQLSDGLGNDTQPKNSFNIYFDGFGISGVDQASIMGTSQFGNSQSAGQFGGLYGPGTTNTWNGFKIFASAGNITGSYVVYGLAK